MKMFVPRLAGCSVIALPTFTLLIQLAQGGNIQGARCVTMLNPATCQSVGNSMCNAGAQGGNCIPNECVYCNDSKTTVPSKNCVNWENFVCNTIQQSQDCNAMATQKSGTCGVQGSCLCLNPNGADNCGTDVENYSCN